MNDDEVNSAIISNRMMNNGRFYALLGSSGVNLVNNGKMGVVMAQLYTQLRWPDQLDSRML